MSSHPDKPSILVLDHNPKGFPDFYAALGALGPVTVVPTIDQLLAEQERHPNRVMLLDVMTLKGAPTALIAHLVERRNREHLGLISDRGTEDYIFDLRRWGIFKVAIKNEPVEPVEVRCFLDCVVDPTNGFGLSRYFDHTVEIHRRSVTSVQEKHALVERIINHFATAGFDVHELYDVRLILEESLNNAFYHAFLTPDGAEKYSIRTFKKLEPGEQVSVEYGTSGNMAGFAVSDNAGALRIKTIIGKLERQFNREGLLDISGRGIYLSRMLCSTHILNVEEDRRTEAIALFDSRRKSQRPKPLIINYIGQDYFEEWRMDTEMD